MEVIDISPRSAVRWCRADDCDARGAEPELAGLAVQSTFLTFRPSMP